ncbi:cobalamin biosynthesis protein [Alteromonas sp. MMG017]|uniref:cobalamin biosynthesis protein CobD/CbiB n=1 Tax=Alteromonas sp. MMG017 TaxID=2822692 RepID=UPI001B39D180|nr:cobalamin biosynthesis protein [Alteromonas sp. MMG017]MBQ4830678.1 cobalamin biosynthesis protein [Alteromonas sp. MMG017]
MEALLTQSAYQSVLVLWLAVILDALWRWPLSSHPLTLMRYLVRQMGFKVLPSLSYSRSQHYISGSLAAIVLLAPLIVCLAILIYMAQYPAFFEAVIMVALLDFAYQRHQFSQILKTVGKNKKVLTRETVDTIVARECTQLTDVGIAKAAIESLWLKFLYLYCGVIFYFMLAGPIGALTYRLLLLTSWQWHYRNPKMVHFAKPVRKLVSLLVIPPALLGCIAVLLFTHPVKGIRAVKRSKARDKTSLLLALFGGIQNIQLGGPAIYHGRKYRYPRVGGAEQVKYSDMIRSKRTIVGAMAVVTAIASVCLLLVAVQTQTLSEVF